MNLNEFFKRQLFQIRQGGWKVINSKISQLLDLIIFSLFLIPAVPLVILLRTTSLFFIIRFGELISSRIGHLAGNTELYLCAKKEGIDIPKKPYLDIFYLDSSLISNLYLLNLWKKILLIYPKIFIHPIVFINKIFPGGKMHEIDMLKYSIDKNNLLDKYSSHISLTNDEELRGDYILSKMGVPLNSKIVCLLVRDSGYLNTRMPDGNWDYHNYRDSEIENYLLAAEYLSDQGFYLIRMGREVNKPFISNKSKIIDYANSKWASDFMDIYLGAKCIFCISTGAGWDSVPALIFRKPTIFTNLVPFSYLPTFSDNFLLTTKRHFSKQLMRELNISEIFSFGVHDCMYTASYIDKNITLIENTPEEIKDVVIEMIEYLDLKKGVNKLDDRISKRFWNLYSELNHKYNKNIILHGKLKSRFSISYLKNNEEWIN